MANESQEASSWGSWSRHTLTRKPFNLQHVPSFRMKAIKFHAMRDVCMQKGNHFCCSSGRCMQWRDVVIRVNCPAKPFLYIYIACVYMFFAVTFERSERFLEALYFKRGRSRLKPNCRGQFPGYQSNRDHNAFKANHIGASCDANWLFFLCFSLDLQLKMGKKNTVQKRVLQMWSLIKWAFRVKIQACRCLRCTTELRPDSLRAATRCLRDLGSFYAKISFLEKCLYKRFWYGHVVVPRTVELASCIEIAESVARIPTGAQCASQM